MFCAVLPTQYNYNDFAVLHGCINFLVTLLQVFDIMMQRWQTTVLRRYSDFIALQEILLIQFPYRVIPRLPPKKVIGTEGL